MISSFHLLDGERRPREGKWFTLNGSLLPPSSSFSSVQSSCHEPCDSLGAPVVWPSSAYLGVYAPISWAKRRTGSRTSASQAGGPEYRKPASAPSLSLLYAVLFKDSPLSCGDGAKMWKPWASDGVGRLGSYPHMTRWEWEWDSVLSHWKWSLWLQT